MFCSQSSSVINKYLIVFIPNPTSGFADFSGVFFYLNHNIEVAISLINICKILIQCLLVYDASGNTTRVRQIQVILHYMTLNYLIKLRI